MCFYQPPICLYIIEFTHSWVVMIASVEIGQLISKCGSTFPIILQCRLVVIYDEMNDSKRICLKLIN
uniref:Uncharacterized protein n=1 Tax=Rhizophora mucronata TaxID=61149 RepID=A0A2P2NKL6_RHIMU